MHPRELWTRVVARREIFRRRWAGFFFWLMLTADVGLCQSGTPAQGDLLAFLLHQNEATWEKIQSLQTLQYTYEEEWRPKQIEQTYHGVAEVKKKGNSYWCTYRRTTFDMRPGEVPDLSQVAGKLHEKEMRLVVNDKYMAEWPVVGNPVALRLDHASIDTMTREVKTNIKISTPRDYLRKCFGNGTQLFREEMQANAGRVRFDGVETKGEDGRLLYQIRRFYPKDAPGPDLIWTLDPQKGFVATESVFQPYGVLANREVMRAEEVAPGIWYPVAEEETDYAMPNQPGEPPVVESWYKGAMKDIKVNEPIADEQFQIEALHLKRDKPDVRVVRTGLDGSDTVYVYRGDGLVPQSVAANVDQIVDKGVDLATTSSSLSGRSSAPPAAKADTGNGRADRVPPSNAQPAAGASRMPWLAMILLAGALVVLVLAAAMVHRRPKVTKDG